MAEKAASTRCVPRHRLPKALETTGAQTSGLARWNASKGRLDPAAAGRVPCRSASFVEQGRLESGSRPAGEHIATMTCPGSR